MATAAKAHGTAVFRAVHHAKLMDKTGFLRNKAEIIKSGGHNINLWDGDIVWVSPVFLCSVTLRISLKGTF